MIRSDAVDRSAWLLTLAASAIVVAALYFAKPVLVPFTLAVLLTFLLAPVCDGLERIRIPRVVAVVLTVVLACAILGTVTWVVVAQVTDLAAKLPQYRGNIEEKLRELHGSVGVAISRVSQTTEELNEKLAETAEVAKTAKAGREPQERSYPVRVVPSPPNPVSIVMGMFGTVFQTLATAGIVLILVIFCLIRREDLRDRFIRLVGQGQVTLTTQALDDAASRVSQYLAMQLLINSTYGAAVAVGLLLLGVPNAILWGMLSAVLRFIPYLGPWIGAILPIAMSLAVAPGWTKPALTVGMFVAIELFSNNVMEPWLYGTRTGISPVAVLVAAVFWTWLWGGVGLLLATPLTVCLVVIGKYVPQLSFLNILLGDQPVFEPKTRVYQRLLAGDMEEATELIDTYLEHNSLVSLYDSVLIPALALAERDRHRGSVDDARHEFVCQSIKEIVEELGDRNLDPDAVFDPADSKDRLNGTRGLNGQRAATRSNGKTSSESHGVKPAPRAVHPESQIVALCLPARDEADEIAGIMLAQLLRYDGVYGEAASAAALASEMVGLAEERADVVCISAVPPAGVAHARYLSKRLRARTRDIGIVVGLWNTSIDLAKAKQRISIDGDVHTVSSVADARSTIVRMLQPLLIQRQRAASETPTSETP